MTKQKLIITIHDFGLTHAVNQGIFDAFADPNNIATNVSLLVTTPGREEASNFAKQHPEISIDLCISLTRNKPCLRTHKTLIDKNGNFKQANTTKWDFSILDEYDPKEIAMEINAQYNWFIKNVGRKPNALTTQRSEHGDPKILMPLVDLAKKENLPIRTPAWEWLTNYMAKQYVLDNKVQTTDLVIVGIKDWRGKFGFDLDTEMDKLIKKLKSVNDGIAELLLFVGYTDEELFEYSSVTWQRGQYLDILYRRPQILNKLKNEFDLISYKDI